MVSQKEFWFYFQGEKLNSMEMKICDNKIPLSVFQILVVLYRMPCGMVIIMTIYKVTKYQTGMTVESIARVASCAKHGQLILH